MSGDDEQREPTVPDSLDKYVPDAEDVLGDEDERAAAGTKVTDAFHTDLPQHRLDHAPASTAVAAEDSEYDEDNENYSGFSERRTYFHPRDAIDSTKYAHLSDVDDHMYDSHYPQRKRRAHRQQDLDIIQEHLGLHDHEVTEITKIINEVNLRECGSPRFETLLLAATRYIYRRYRECTLVNSEFAASGEIRQQYINLRENYDCTRSAVDTVFTHIQSTEGQYR